MTKRLILLVILLAGLVASPINGQAPADDRKLTPEEIKAWQSLEAQILDRQQKLRVAQKRMLDAEADDPGAFEAAARATCVQLRRLDDLVLQVEKWQASVKQRANCPACFINFEKRILIDPSTTPPKQ